MSRVIGWFVHDTFVTWEEIRGLMAGLLAVETPATGTTRLTDWMHTHAATLGRQYASELRRREERRAPYLPQ